MSILSTDYNLIAQKLKREWKTFTFAVSGLLVAAGSMAAQMGASVPDFLNWVPEKYKSGALFAFSVGFLLLRKYSPTTVIQASEAPVEPEAPVVPVV